MAKLHRLSLTEEERLYLVREVRTLKKTWALYSGRYWPQTHKQPDLRKISEDLRRRAKAEVMLAAALLRKLRPKE